MTGFLFSQTLGKAAGSGRCRVGPVQIMLGNATLGDRESLLRTGKGQLLFVRIRKRVWLGKAWLSKARCR